MKSFQEHLNSEPDTIDESFMRGASALVLMNHIQTQRKIVRQSRKVDLKTINALASMVLASASLTFAMTQLPPEQRNNK